MGSILHRQEQTVSHLLQNKSLLICRCRFQTTREAKDGNLNTGQPFCSSAAERESSVFNRYILVNKEADEQAGSRSSSESTNTETNRAAALLDQAAPQWSGLTPGTPASYLRRPLGKRRSLIPPFQNYQPNLIRAGHHGNGADGRWCLH